ncbi:peptidoglycan-binding protein LysM [Cypionkella aquatica]|uniref:Peptidoglycan-binding protein LysM n=1 Tax=Cypionkella aquatica TaxID=1756042 RepID=A0AA37U2R2_9RHOB|nr:LysM peptidoglycan-binding domain-containing protein [Cypionkella aquatica]GLS87331.1 peptidoglycan-binding protein LysM [Cypionkella aquatica]
MAGWNALNSAARGAVVAGGAAVLAVVAYLGFASGPDAPPPGPAPDQVAVADPAAQPAATDAPAAVSAETEASADPAASADVAASPETTVETVPAQSVADAPSVPDVAPAAVILPSFDVARVAADGAATVAGIAAPGAAVKVLVDGVEVAQAKADAQGKFAALFDVTLGPDARMLSLQAVGVDGVIVPGADSVALAPIVAAPIVASPTQTTPGAATGGDAGAEPVLQAPSAVLVAPDGVKVLQSTASASADVGGSVGVDTISYAPDGAVLLGGRAAAAAPLRIYLDGAAIADVTAGGDGAWAATLRDVAAGIYTLRVDQLGADGKVSSRFETPFKRETVEDLAAALQQPGSSADPASPAPDAANAPASAQGTQAPVADPQSAAPATVTTSQAAMAADAAGAEPAAVDPAAAMAEAAAPEAAEAAGAEMATTAVQPALAAAKPAPVSVTVQPGYTLWGIAQQNFGDGVMYVQVFEANKAKIKDPDLIYPGQVFTIPAAP